MANSHVPLTHRNDVDFAATAAFRGLLPAKNAVRLKRSKRDLVAKEDISDAVNRGTSGRSHSGSTVFFGGPSLKLLLIKLDRWALLDTDKPSENP